MKDIELQPLPEPTALGMDFDKGWDGVRAYGYTEEDMASYARAAVEADRAQRVPEGWKLVPVDPTDRMLNAASLATESEGMVTTPWLRKTIYFAMLSAAPAQPAQQPKPSPIKAEHTTVYQSGTRVTRLELTDEAKESLRADVSHIPGQPAQKPTTSVPWMTARRAAYFMERFLHEEKMLGPNEQDALRFTIEALEAMATTHQEPPQQERKPMTDEQDRALCEAFCNAASDEYFKAHPQLDSDVNRRIFYAGHRNAWLEWQAAHGIKE